MGHAVAGRNAEGDAVLAEIAILTTKGIPHSGSEVEAEVDVVAPRGVVGGDLQQSSPDVGVDSGVERVVGSSGMGCYEGGDFLRETAHAVGGGRRQRERLGIVFFDFGVAQRGLLATMQGNGHHQEARTQESPAGTAIDRVQQGWTNNLMPVAVCYLSKWGGVISD